MAKFRKKPVVIEAIQLTDGLTSGDLCDFFGYDGMSISCLDKFRIDGVCVYIKTLEGEMKAGMNDWIIKGVAGEFYPCKPDIFAATYEAVDA